MESSPFHVADITSWKSRIVKKSGGYLSRVLRLVTTSRDGNGGFEHTAIDLGTGSAFASVAVTFSLADIVSRDLGNVASITLVAVSVIRPSSRRRRLLLRCCLLTLSTVFECFAVSHCGCSRYVSADRNLFRRHSGGGGRGGGGGRFRRDPARSRLVTSVNALNAVTDDAVGAALILRFARRGGTGGAIGFLLPTMKRDSGL